MISLIHPSRGRPEQAINAAEKWIYSYNGKVEYILSLDEDDKMEYGAQCVNPIRNKNRSAVDAINNAAKIAKGDIIVVMSDDFDCPENWGQQIIEATKGKTDWILKTPDGIQDWMITLPIMDRVYYNRFGYIYHPDYLHMFCDTEMSCVADLTGRRLTANIPFKHNHYSVTGQPRDAISIKADSTWDYGERLFIERSKRNFDLPLKDLHGRIQNNPMINWMRAKGLQI